MDKVPKTALLSLLFNLAFCAYHIVLSVITHSWWLFTVGIYYVILSTARFVVLITKDSKRNLHRLVGVLLMILSLPLSGTVILSFLKERGTVFHEIVMITIALYTFIKITLATANWIRARTSTSSKLITLKNLAFADSFVSIFSLQRSMLVSFNGMSDASIRMMNLATGSGVCVLVYGVGLNLLRNKRLLFRKLK